MLNGEGAEDDEVIVEPVVDYLSQLPDDEIFHFEELLAQKLQALDTKEHAKEIGEGAYTNDVEYFSVDGFLYSRCVVVANGKTLFQHILRTQKNSLKIWSLRPYCTLRKKLTNRKMIKCGIMYLQQIMKHIKISLVGIRR